MAFTLLSQYTVPSLQPSAEPIVGVFLMSHT